MKPKEQKQLLENLSKGISDSKKEFESTLDECDIDDLINRTHRNGYHMGMLDMMKYSGKLSDTDIGKLYSHTSDIHMHNDDIIHKCQCRQKP